MTDFLLNLNVTPLEGYALSILLYVGLFWWWIPKGASTAQELQDAVIGERLIEQIRQTYEKPLRTSTALPRTTDLPTALGD